jgi:hypothetical protein
MADQNQPGVGQGALALLSALKGRHKKVERAALKRKRRGKRSAHGV